MRLFEIQVARLSVVMILCMTVLFSISAVGLSSAHAWYLPSVHNPTASGPKAIVPFTSFTFGDVYTGEILTQIFAIRNDGDAELLIKDFKGDCGCTATRSDRVIAPGKEGTAEVEIQTISLAGLINKTATLHTNDPERPSITFTIVANLVKGPPQRQGKYIGPIFLSPGSQTAMYAFPGKTAAIELLVTAGAAPVKVLRAESGTKHFAARVEVIEAGKSYKILVESLPNEAGGNYTDRLRVTTDNPTLPAFNVDLFLRVYPRE